jgi:hypothetical protein
MSRELVKLSTLKAVEHQRKPGYIDACLAAGHLDPETQMVRFTPEAWMKLRQAYALPQPVTVAGVDVPKSTVGLGDLVHSVALPIARAVGMDCVDKATNDLKPGSPCAHRQDFLNKVQLPKLF